MFALTPAARFPLASRTLPHKVSSLRFAPLRYFAGAPFEHFQSVGVRILFVLGYARDGVYRMKRLALSNDDFHFVVRGVKLLGSDERVEWKLNGKYLEIRCKTRFEDDMPLCFDINVD